MNKIKQLLRQQEMQLFIFCLLFVLVNWPILAVAVNGGLIAMFRYLSLLCVIILLILFLIHMSLRSNVPAGPLMRRKDDTDV